MTKLSDNGNTTIAFTIRNLNQVVCFPRGDILHAVELLYARSQSVDVNTRTMINRLVAFFETNAVKSKMEMGLLSAMQIYTLVALLLQSSLSNSIIHTQILVQDRIAHPHYAKPDTNSIEYKTIRSLSELLSILLLAMQNRSRIDIEVRKAGHVPKT